MLIDGIGAYDILKFCLPGDLNLERPLISKHVIESGMLQYLKKGKKTCKKQILNQ